MKNFSKYFHNKVVKDTNQNLSDFTASDAICCAAVSRNPFKRQVVRTLSGDRLRVGKSRDDTIDIDGASVIQCDLSGTNGVVHVIDDVFYKQRRKWRHNPFRLWDF